MLSSQEPFPPGRGITKENRFYRRKMNGCLVRGSNYESVAILIHNGGRAGSVIVSIQIENKNEKCSER